MSIYELEFQTANNVSLYFIVLAYVEQISSDCVAMTVPDLQDFSLQALLHSCQASSIQMMTERQHQKVTC